MSNELIDCVIGSVATLAIGITNASGGVVLIDEIENGIHHSVMTEVWLGIAKLACQSDVQIFATTHSFECINAAHQAFKKSGQYDFRLHRLDQVDDSIEAVTLDEEALEVATQMGMEVFLFLYFFFLAIDEKKKKGKKKIGRGKKKKNTQGKNTRVRLYVSHISLQE